MMDSFFANFYLDLCERIRAAVPEVKWIEQDFGQDVFDKWRPNVGFPAVLIDFPTAQYSGESGLSQFGEVSVSLRLLVAPFSQSYENAPLEVKKEALKYFEIEQQLVDALHGWTPSPVERAGGEVYCQPLVRSSITSNNRNDIGLRIRNLSFTTAYEEDF